MHCLSGEEMERIVGRRQAGGGSVMPWAMLCWETLGPGSHVDVTLKCTIRESHMKGGNAMIGYDWL